MEQKSILNNQQISSLSRWIISLTVVTALLVLATIIYNRSRAPQTSQSNQPKATISTPVLEAVTALGRIEPKGEVIQLSAPASAERVRVEKLLVKERESVRSQQVIAILDTRNRLEVALKQAKQQAKIAQAQLAQVLAGAKQGEIMAQKANITRIKAQLAGDSAAQQATIARLEAEFRNGKSEFQRYNSLYQQGAIAASVLDDKRLVVDTLQQQINEAKATFNRIQTTASQQVNEAKATLDKIAEVRPVDVQEAKARLDNDLIAVERAKVELDYAYVRSPIYGQVIKIHTKAGESISDRGIAELGRTDQMNVIAEVYETDIGKITVGQTATITSDVFANKLVGKVEHIGLQINKKDVLDTDPAANVDARVVEVEIRLRPQDSKQVIGFSRLQVKVAIDIKNANNQINSVKNYSVNGNKQN